MKILYLEDLASQSTPNKKKLERIGFEVIVVASSEEAVSTIKKHDDIDLFLCDINLDNSETDSANNINGIHVAKKIVESYILPVLLFTHHNIDSYRDEAQSVLGDYYYEFVSKKILNENENRLYQKIESTIENFYLKGAYKPVFEKRRIGISKGKGMPHYFYSKDDIIFLTSEDKNTRIYFTSKNENGENDSVVISASLAATTRRIQYSFPNIIKLGRRHTVNLEKLIKLEGKHLTLEGTSKSIILEGAWEAILLKHKLLIRTH